MGSNNFLRGVLKKANEGSDVKITEKKLLQLEPQLNATSTLINIPSKISKGGYGNLLQEMWDLEQSRKSTGYKVVDLIAEVTRKNPLVGKQTEEALGEKYQQLKTYLRKGADSAFAKKPTE